MFSFKSIVNKNAFIVRFHFNFNRLHLVIHSAINRKCFKETVRAFVVLFIQSEYRVIVKSGKCV